MKRLKTFWWTGMALLLTGAALAQTPSPVQHSTTNDPSAAIEQWIDENVDTDVLQFLDQFDEDRVKDFFNKALLSFDSTNVYDLAPLKAIAVQIIPVLKQYEETEPYADWLEAHLDDFDAADEIKREMKAAPPAKGQGVLSGPTLKLERSVWVHELSRRPLPPLAKTYLPMLKQVFISERVPPQLVWVADVESAFHPKARSPAGAAGMFQLMSTTARTEHLSLWPFDERYQPEKSAHAAAGYLRELHAHYHDWQLALAAYNVGEARVDKLLKQHKARHFEAIARWLPAETQMYVPKVEATILEREGLALTDLKTPRG
jgi:membrane-bound lytic murein transglycosylase D